MSIYTKAMNGSTAKMTVFAEVVGESLYFKFLVNLMMESEMTPEEMLTGIAQWTRQVARGYIGDLTDKAKKFDILIVQKLEEKQYYFDSYNYEICVELIKELARESNING